MNIEFLEKFIQPLTVLFCLLFGYAWKQVTDKGHKYIPVGCMVLGGIFSGLTLGWDVTTVIGGVLSGAASSKFYDLFITFLNSNKGE